MSKLIEFLKEIYIKATQEELDWKNVYPNNMPCNGVEGIYTDMFFKNSDGKYKYVKYTIQFHSRCDEEGISHPAEGPKYYVMHELVINDLDEKFEIPEPSDKFKWDDEYGHLVNNYGRFRYVFDDCETAKKVVSKDLLRTIYPYTYILSDDEIDEWNDFVQKQKGENL